MRYLHTMVRVLDLESSLIFYRDALGLKETRRTDVPEGKFTLLFLSCDDGVTELELTYNWESKEELTGGRNFGHLAYEVDDIYQFCENLMDLGIKILRPPRDGRMAFIRSPDNISVELLQKGDAKEVKAPWCNMENQGEW